MLVVVLAHLQGGCGRQGAGLRRGGGGRRRCALLEWRQVPWAVGGPRQAVRRAGSEWPAGVGGDEQPGSVQALLKQETTATLR